MRYANHECAKCGAFLPANELTTVTDRVFTGSTVYQRRSHGTLRPGGRSDHFANRARRLCASCLTKRRIGQQAFGAVALTLFAPALGLPAIGIGLVSLLLFVLRRWLGLLLVGGVVAGGVVLLISAHPTELLQRAGAFVSWLSPSHTSTTAAHRDEQASTSSPKADRLGRASFVGRKHRAVHFAASTPVVQALPTSGSDYPPCSAAVTDHCIGR